MIKKSDLHKVRNSVEEGIKEGKIKAFYFFIIIDLTDNSLFKIIPTVHKLCKLRSVS